MADRVPVTLVAGFIGAGKTTLLNILLRQPAHARAFVLVNGSGTLALDHPWTEPLRDTPFQRTGGCACCSGRDELTRVLRRLLPRARRGEITRIIIEAAGFADPAGVLAALAGDAIVSSVYGAAEVITVVDGRDGLCHLQRHAVVSRQIADADRLALTKLDGTDADALLRAVRRLNPDAPVVALCNGRLQPPIAL